MSEIRLSDLTNTDVVWSLERELYDPRIVLTFVSPGEPVSKSRARFTGKGSKTRAYTPEKTRQAEENMGWLARQAGATGQADGDSSFGLFTMFFCGTWQRRDADNMLKLVSDALTGVVWKDDDQVVEMSARLQRGVDDPRTHVAVYRCLTSRPPTNPCEICGSPVRQYKSQTNRYCSSECSGQARRRRVTLFCLNCGEGFEKTKASADRIKKPLCSERCRYAVQVVERPCEWCGEMVRRPRSQTRKRLFCSTGCAGKWRTGKPRNV